MNKYAFLLLVHIVGVLLSGYTRIQKMKMACKSYDEWFWNFILIIIELKFENGWLLVWKTIMFIKL